MYDNEDNVCGVIYNENPFYFFKNLQGDIIALVDKSGKVTARYSYDAWGVCTIESDTSGCNMATINPYRYRGYYYDVEIGMYYLQSRYYDPEIGKFLNSDTVEIVLLSGINNSGKNLWTYSSNNPVCYIDSTGYIATNIISGIIGALLNVLIDLFTSALAYWARNRFSFRGFKYNFFSWNTALAAASGFAAGLILSSKYKRWICAVGGGIVSGLTNIISCIINRRRFSLKDLLVDIGFGLVWGYLGGSGVGRSYWQKNLFSKRGAFVYKGIRYYSSRSLRLIKPVVKDFVKSFGIYIVTQLGDWLQKFARGKV